MTAHKLAAVGAADARMMKKKKSKRSPEAAARRRERESKRKRRTPVLAATAGPQLERDGGGAPGAVVKLLDLRVLTDWSAAADALRATVCECPSSLDMEALRRAAFSRPETLALGSVFRGGVPPSLRSWIRGTRPSPTALVAAAHDL